MLSSAEVQVTGHQNLKTPNDVGEWGSELKLHCRSAVGLQRPHKCGQMFEELTNPKGSWVAWPQGPEEPGMDWRRKHTFRTNNALPDCGRFCAPTPRQFHLQANTSRVSALSSIPKALRNSLGPLQPGCTRLRRQNSCAKRLAIPRRDQARATNPAGP